MQNQPSTLQFSLRALFIVTAFVGLGLLALKYPSPWALLVVSLAVLLLFAYAVVASLVSTGNRRLFWAAFAATAVTRLLGQYTIVPYDCIQWLWVVLHPPGPHSDPAYSGGTTFHAICANLSVVVVSTIAAYLIPWLVRRGKQQQ